ncbi:MAG: DUF1805 domain-containing protein [Candidatus Omnitrophica bacterium]|nr:DUF1805 domain-containing protein [Candidatus Omnitrophota bacterium]MBU2044264.1 DUF1805 domain-containing protein [Candidatus Omnitrophota bacterium]MBU2251510.1 DUF1805 domain-containing protein [Candidatus Omnitrophota bacterium]MBU2474059.1 DUF1805 domain-containing protein [Candidatus Omnitrophota bacterium]
MVDSQTIKAGKKKIRAFSLNLGKNNLIVLLGRRGYCMCGYLNLGVARKFADAAVKITGVSSIQDALKARVHSLTPAAKRLGLKKGQAIKDVLKIIA